MLLFYHFQIQKRSYDETEEHNDDIWMEIWGQRIDPEPGHAFTYARIYLVVVDCLEIRSLPLETRKKGLLKLISLSTCFNLN